MENLEETLLQCPLFRNMNLSQISEVLQKYPSQEKSFTEKDFVILQNEVCDKLMIVLEGLVQAQMVDSSGKLIVIEELGACQLLAPAFLFSEINRMPVSVYVLKNTRILSFRKSVFLTIMQENQITLLNFLSMISDRSRFLSEKLKFHAFMPLRNKVSHYLLEESVRQKSLQIKLRHTQQELADKFGVARPSLARILAELEKEGIIEVKNKIVTITCINLLREKGYDSNNNTKN